MPHMDEMTHPGSASTLAEVAPSRACSRCDGEQHLVGESAGLGKYRCDHCQLVVGFDLESSPPEFLLHRGLPGRYSKDQFGTQLAAVELRLN